MATVRDIVQRAYRKIGVVASDEAMTADQAEAGGEALNMMMAAWELAGVNVAHNNLTLSDLFPLQPKFEEGTVYMLASRLAPDFSQPSFDDSQWMQKLQAAYLFIDAVRMPSALRTTPSQRWRRA
jgi:hypothetical protein